MGEPSSKSRREFLGLLGRGAGVVALGGVLGTLILRQRSAVAGETLWQIDPLKCTHCGRCATECVLNPSAVRCMHAFAYCGYCDLCTGFFEASAPALNTGAENQTCPTAAIRRSFVEEPYFEYTIDHDLCIGCARCVKGCVSFGNGSLHLQIDQELCRHCNRCSIAANCPSNAITRVEPSRQYIPPRVKGS